jgi:Protein of unknown function (DUF3631)
MTVTLERAPETAARQLGFTWSCGHREYASGYTGPGAAVSATCIARGTDPAEYVKHLRGHGARSLHPSVPKIRLRPKPPAATLRKLPVDPMAEIAWTHERHEPGVCGCGHGAPAHRSPYDSDCKPQEEGCDDCGCTVGRWDIDDIVTSAERRGQFWADGPRPGSVWVMPFEAAPWEDSPQAVDLALPIGDEPHISGRALDRDPRRLVRLADTVARQGVYGTLIGTSWIRPAYQWHTGDCPEASGAHDRAPWHQVRKVIAVILGEHKAPRDMALCRHCIWQDAGEPEAGDIVTETEPEQEAPEAAETGERDESKMLGGLGTVIRVAGAIQSPTRTGMSTGAPQPPAHQSQPNVSTPRERLAAAHAMAAQAAGITEPAAGTVAVPGAGAVEPKPVQGVVVLKPRDHIDGAELLTYTRNFLRTFVVFPNPETEIMTAAWIGASHGRGEDGLPVYPYAPRYAALSPKPGGGKSWLIRIMAKIVPDGKRLLEPSEAYVARTIGYQHKTVFLDEADLLFGTGKRKQALRSIINGGYEPDGEWGRASGSGTGTNDVPTFGFLGFAGLDVLKTGTGDHLNATLDRCLFAYMRKAPEGYRPPRFDARALAATEWLRERWALFLAQEIADGVAEDIPDLGSLGNRPAALWEPLAMVCDRAGGPWPDLIRDSCETLESAKGLPYQDAGDWASCRSIIDGYGGQGGDDQNDLLD